jgi:AMP-polyphosphate phosphotransferase
MLERLDLSLKMPRDEYDRWLKILQADLHQLAYQVYLQKLPVILVFEGMDASGKGGNIKRLTEKMDPRGYVVWPIAAPHGDDRERHYLYRFWRRLPEQGQNRHL